MLELDPQDRLWSSASGDWSFFAFRALSMVSEGSLWLPFEEYLRIFSIRSFGLVDLVESLNLSASLLTVRARSPGVPAQGLSSQRSQFASFVFRDALEQASE